MKDTHVAVTYDNKGKCIHVSKVKVLTKGEVLELENQVNEHDAEVEIKEAKIDEDIGSLQKQVQDLKKVLCHILGYEELKEEEIKEYLGVIENEKE